MTPAFFRYGVGQGPHATPTPTPGRHSVTSMCLEIADFTHDDCPGDWCRCTCHTQTSPASATTPPEAGEHHVTRQTGSPAG
jgi:hypothetical protein